MDDQPDPTCTCQPDGTWACPVSVGGGCNPLVDPVCGGGGGCDPSVDDCGGGNGGCTCDPQFDPGCDPACELNGVESAIITNISPSSAKAGSAGLSVAVLGANFTTGSVLQLNGANRTTTVVSSTLLLGSISASDLASVGPLTIGVNNPSSSSNGGVTSNLAVLASVRKSADFDFDGDGKADRLLWSPSAGVWSVIRSSIGLKAALNNLGQPGDIPVAGDYDGDGKADIAVWRPSTGEWRVIYSSNGASAVIRIWGTAGDVPVPADYDGDGKTDLAVWRPSTGEWWVALSSRQYQGTMLKSLGVSGDIPVVGDYDGDGKADPGIWRPSTGEWWIAPSSKNYTGSMFKVWGIRGDRPIAEDFDGDGKTDLGIWRPSTGEWWVASSSQNYSGAVMGVLGIAGDIPVANDYDGDGKADLGVWCPDTHNWQIALSSQKYLIVMDHVDGAADDVPVPSNPPLSSSASSATIPPPSAYAGYLDQADCTGIAGWAWNSAQNSSFINVDLYDGSTLLATVPTSLFRPDLPNAGIGNGYHAFYLASPAGLQDGSVHTISAKFGGTGISLSTSPKKLTCAASLMPSISSISPSNVPNGGPGFTLTITGNNFASGASVVVSVGNSSSIRPAVFVSSTQLNIQITSSDVATSGTQVTIAIANPAPGGWSNQVILNVQ
ncbi:MAG TPA: VCBS repeat-containing protein [Candidatus Angelobacter sp.]